ncbi:phosphate regulon sensor histidine kinase PhoR [Curvibacter sp. RS43]|uniref:phosphate regulon sensor histidine kinase PhoR n=1 Tax=Curvibacter microcysteis TaxID=3026419 RepID=UPI0023610F4F|nr:phosphate regulon sensor histidine kinase PhoR [Curvibacter sp. RS43]MDD0809090.1 phosphate regulon sensor histidine kinase PhoR [Curvibacter sp. RS43]
MTFRFLSFVGAQLLAGALGWALAEWLGASIAVVVGTWVWFLLDVWRGLSVRRWLRKGDANAAPQIGGLWGEVSDRARRLLRQEAKKAGDSEQRLQDFLAAIQASPNGVVLLDPEGHIEWCNQTAAEHFGFDPQRDLMQSIGNLLRDPLFAAYYASRDYSHDIVMSGRDSTVSRPVRLSVHLHAYGEGRRLLLSRDVTALDQADAMRRDFVANVSHEIRTPLTVLSGFIETLQTLNLEPQERQHYLSLMAQQGSRMQTVVNDLLTLSRLEGSPAPGLNDWQPVGALLQHCEQEALALSGVVTAHSGRRHQIHFDDTQAQGVDLAGSHNELQSALSNLISNAVRYTPGGGSIQVSWRMLPDGRAEFEVRDTGPGIAPEHIPRLTERFYRVDRSRSRETGGTGLGLAIVKHVVQRHGAQLLIESSLGVGSRFAITFPASRLRCQPLGLNAGASALPSSAEVRSKAWA